MHIFIISIVTLWPNYNSANYIYMAKLSFIDDAKTYTEATRINSINNLYCTFLLNLL